MQFPFPSPRISPLLADANETIAVHGAFCALLLAIAAGLMWHHTHAWNIAKIQPENLRAIEFARAQYRRRMLASGLVGVVGLAILSAVSIRDAFMAACFWMAMLMLVLWILALAMIDAAQSFKFLRQQHRRHLVERAELQAELLREIRRLRENKND